MLLSHPVIRLVGPSGVGKSSLIRAGILPKIREFGWRACVIRPFENPAKQVVPQLTAGLLANPGKFSAPLDPAKFRAEVTPPLSAAGITRLVLLIDQFEDIVSPVTDPTALDLMRSFLAAGSKSVPPRRDRISHGCGCAPGAVVAASQWQTRGASIPGVARYEP